MSKKNKEIDYIMKETMLLLNKMEDTNLDPDFCSFLLMNVGMSLSLANNDGDFSNVEFIYNYAKKNSLEGWSEIEEEEKIDGTVH